MFRLDILDEALDTLTHELKVSRLDLPGVTFLYWSRRPARCGLRRPAARIPKTLLSFPGWLVLVLRVIFIHQNNEAVRKTDERMQGAGPAMPSRCSPWGSWMLACGGAAGRRVRSAGDAGAAGPGRLRHSGAAAGQRGAGLRRAVRRAGDLRRRPARRAAGNARSPRRASGPAGPAAWPPGELQLRLAAPGEPEPYLRRGGWPGPATGRHPCTGAGDRR